MIKSALQAVSTLPVGGRRVGEVVILKCRQLGEERIGGKEDRSHVVSKSENHVMNGCLAVTLLRYLEFQQSEQASCLYLIRNEIIAGKR